MKYDSVKKQIFGGTNSGLRESICNWFYYNAPESYSSRCNDKTALAVKGTDRNNYSNMKKIIRVIQFITPPRDRHLISFYDEKKGCNKDEWRNQLKAAVEKALVEVSTVYNNKDWNSKKKQGKRKRDDATNKNVGEMKELNFSTMKKHLTNYMKEIKFDDKFDHVQAEEEVNDIEEEEV